MSTEEKPPEKFSITVLDPTSIEARKLLEDFDEETMEPRRFSGALKGIRPEKPSSPK